MKCKCPEWAKWLRLLYIPLILITIYALNFARLSLTPPKRINLLEGLAPSTEHTSNSTKTFIPEKIIDPPWTSYQRFDEYTAIGGHHFYFVQWWKGFDPERPAGYVTYKGRLVSYFWSGTKEDVERTGYHWHTHHNMCLMEGLAATTEYNWWECISKGYFFMFGDGKWMLHYNVNAPVGFENEMEMPYLENEDTRHHH